MAALPAKVHTEYANNHVAVLCLSLMGTNWIEQITEAYRVLAPGGYLYIANTAQRHADLTGVSTSNSTGDPTRPDSDPFLANMEKVFQLVGQAIPTNAGRFKIFRFSKSKSSEGGGSGALSGVGPAALMRAKALTAAALSTWGHTAPEFEAPAHPVFPALCSSSSSSSSGGGSRYPTFGLQPLSFV